MADEFPSLYSPAAGAGATVNSASPGTGAATGSSNSSNSAAAALEQMHAQQADAGAADAAGGAAQGGSSGSGSSSSANRRSGAATGLDLGNEELFPSLGAPAAPPGKGKGTAAGWGAAARSRQQQQQQAQAQVQQQPSHTEVLTLPTSSISVTPVQQKGGFSNAPPEATTLGGVLSQLMQRFASSGLKLESSSSTARGTTTVIIKAQRIQDIERVKRDLLARIVKKVNETLNVPASTRAFIIGAKGRTLKSIVEETGVNIQIPRDSAPAAATAASDEPEYVADGDSGEAEDPLIPINLFGDAPSVQAAKQRILAIVKERTSRTSTKVSTVPHELYHLLSAKHARGELVSAQDAEEASVEIRIPPVWKLRAGAGRGVSANDASVEGAAAENGAAEADGRDLSITVVGDREAVSRTVDAITAAADELARTSQTISMTLNKRQHRFILPPVSDSILAATRCAIEVPPASSPSDQITIRGPPTQLVEALQAVMSAASAAAVDTVDLASLHGVNTPNAYPKQAARYLIVKGKLRKIADEESVQIYIPRAGDSHTTIDIVATQGPKGPQAAVAAARSKVVDVLKPLSPQAFANVEVDPLVHRFLIGRKGSKISQFEEKNAVQVVFPPSSSGASAGDSDILLVYVGADSAAAGKTLQEVREEILKLAKEAADISSTTLNIPAKLHRFIIGPNGTTLNAIIGTGDERIVNVRFGSSSTGAAAGSKDAKNADEDEVVVRGPSDEVKKTVREIERIAEEAKNDEIVNSYTAEFEIEQRFVSHIVGRGGASIQKLREDLGVRIDFGDQAVSASAADSQASKGKKASGTIGKAGAGTKAQVKIQGRKENVEEAKKRILKQTEQLADETTLSVPMLSGTERGSLIGKQGAYVQRLEAKYDVRINFPRAGEDDGSSGDAITIRGGKKGAEGAKRELVELMEYEKENNQSSTFTVPAKALPRIFGRQGQAIRELQDESGAEIDVQKNEEKQNAIVTIRGTKQAIANAKKQIQATVAEIQDETTLEMQIERQYHVNIIGKGGQNIRDIIARAGGPSDSRAAGQMVRFPRAGEADDLVVIRAPSSIASKIQAELEAQLSSLRDRVVYGVAVPQSSHARLIGRGGAGVNELQRKHGVRIVMSNWSEFRSAGELVNPQDVEGSPDTDIIKVLGSQKAAEAAAAEIKERVAAAPAQGAAGQQRQRQAGPGAGAGGQREEAPIAKTVNVPSHLHTRVTQGGKFFRTLPSGIRIDHGNVQPPSASSGAAGGAKVNGASAAAARIDADEDGEEDSEFHWEVTELSNAPAAGEQDIPWNIRGTDDAKVDRVEGMIKAAIERCARETHKGVLTVPQSLIPRIVGRQGSGLEKLRATGVSAEVEGRSGANSVIFIGSAENLEEAKRMVMELREAQRNRA